MGVAMHPPLFSFAVHRATKRAHFPAASEWKLAEKISRYLEGSKDLLLRMTGRDGMSTSHKFWFAVLMQTLLLTRRTMLEGLENVL